MRVYFGILWMLAMLWACSNDDGDRGELNTYGAGDYNFTSYPPFAQKPVKCFYHIPPASHAQTPIMVVVHGAGRDGRALRNALVQTANEKQFIVLAPQFSSDYFPGSNAFNLAHIFQNGEQPSPSTLQPREEWTFQVIDPIFEGFKAYAGSAVGRYDLFGHSAGAQLVHRFLQFEPQAQYSRLVSSAAGWYMLPDPSVQFPYGQGLSPAAEVSPLDYFERLVYIVVGDQDTDPNSFNLRHTPQADAQGLQRVERAAFMYQYASDAAAAGGHDFNWQYHEAPGIGHNSAAMAIFAAGLLYD